MMTVGKMKTVTATIQIQVWLRKGREPDCKTLSLTFLKSHLRMGREQVLKSEVLVLFQEVNRGIA